MDNNDDRLNSAKEMLKKFQQSNQTSQASEDKLNSAKELLRKFQEAKKGSSSQSSPLPTAATPHESAVDTAIPSASSLFESASTVSNPNNSHSLGDYFKTGGNDDSFQMFQPIESAPPNDGVVAQAAPVPKNPFESVVMPQPAPVPYFVPGPVPPQELHEVGNPTTYEDQQQSESSANEKVDPGYVADLEQRNKELEAQVERQKASLHQYEGQILSTTSMLQEAQSALEMERNQNSEKHEVDSERLSKELESCKESINFLVTEKAEIEATLKRVQQALEQKTNDFHHLEKQFDDSQAEIRKKDVELQEARSNKNQCEEVKRLEQSLAEQKTLLAEERQDQGELRAKLTAKEEENANLNKELANKTSKLEMAELNLMQLRSASSSTEYHENELKEKENEISELKKKLEDHKSRETDLAAYIQQLTQDREQIIQQYTAYSKQLTSQIENLTKKLNEKTKHVDQLEKRESGLVTHVSQLESQLQNLMQAQKQNAAAVRSSPARHDSQEDSIKSQSEIEHLRKKIAEMDAQVTNAFSERDNLMSSCEHKDKEIHSLKMALVERESAISELETKNEMLEAAASGNVNSNDLVAACESDKVAASRAMAQNQQLKAQVEELETAVINLTNSKADLASELETLKHSKSKTSEVEATFKMEISALQEAVRERDRNITQLKEDLKHYSSLAESRQPSISNETNNRDGDEEVSEKDDLIKHCESLRQELEEAHANIHFLTNQNSELRSQIEVISSPTRETSRTPRDTPATFSENGGLTASHPSSGTSSRQDTYTDDDLGNHHNNDHNTNEDDQKMRGNKYEETNAQKKNDTVPVLSRDVATMKLEQKFFDAMNRIAELLAEKEHLEHVTVQLQEETETVGEYITLYQYQRQQIKKRLEEKEAQLQVVSLEREQLKSKVEQLQGLVKDYLASKGAALDQQQSGSLPSTTQTSNPMNGVNSNDYIEIAEEATPSMTDSASEQKASVKKGDKDQQERAEKILALISEIGSNQMLHEDFHPWFFWEHSNPGRLMTV